MRFVLPFVYSMITSPHKVGAIAPSGRKLTRVMVKQAMSRFSSHRGEWIVELGAGTGVFTQAMLEAGVPASHLLVVEREARLFNVLRRRFPEAQVIREDALNLGDLLAQRQIKKVAAVVSGLPLLVMPGRVQAGIVREMAEAIGQHGVLVQFTYSLRSPINKKLCRQHHLVGRRKRLVMLNFPPASVWIYRVVPQ